MEFNIILTGFAESQIEELFNCIEKTTQRKNASRIVQELAQAMSKLALNPYMGQKEQLLENRKVVYRYILFKNFKIIYSVDKKNTIVYVVDIFDTRQNPNKITRFE